MRCVYGRNHRVEVRSVALSALSTCFSAIWLSSIPKPQKNFLGKWFSSNDELKVPVNSYFEDQEESDFLKRVSDGVMTWRFTAVRGLNVVPRCSKKQKRHTFVCMVGRELFNPPSYTKITNLHLYCTSTPAILIFFTNSTFWPPFFSGKSTRESVYKRL